MEDMNDDVTNLKLEQSIQLTPMERFKQPRENKKEHAKYKSRKHK